MVRSLLLQPSMVGASQPGRATIVGCLAALAIAVGSRSDGFRPPHGICETPGDACASTADEHIRAAVQRGLADALGAPASAIHVAVRGGGVTLIGEVTDDRERYQVEKITYRVDGVERVDNRLRVKRPPVNPRAM